MSSLTKSLIISLFCFIPFAGISQQKIHLDLSGEGRVFEGIGALSAGASSRLLLDYKEPYRSQILDFLFKPKYGAGFQHLKVEIGGNINSTDGSEPSHAHTQEEFEHPKPEYFQRGYEWMLMKEAKKRNPAIFLDCLEWGCPGWIRNGRFYSLDNAKYIASFISGAKRYHNLTIDYTGGWNERPYNLDWYELLRKTLDENNLNTVKIVGGDVWDWVLADEIQTDPELKRSISVLGIHYIEDKKQLSNRWHKTQYSSTESAKNSGIPLWNSEGGPWMGNWNGFSWLAKMYNRNYIDGRITKNITWSLITSYYDNLSLPNSGVMKAKTPWSGYYEIEPALWASAHTTQFCEPGWRYIDSGCGYLTDSIGSYVSLRDPLTNDFSIIIETMDAVKSICTTINLSKGSNVKLLKVWKSTLEKDAFVQESDLRVKNGKADVILEPHSVYSITTTLGQQKGNPTPPANTAFPYQADFENDLVNQLPRYFSDQAGIFEVHYRADGQGKCLKQVVNQQGIEWETGEAFVQSIIGDTLWTDYQVSCDINITENTGSAFVMGRVSNTYRGMDFPEAYIFKVFSPDRWQLLAGKEILASGAFKFPLLSTDTWHTLKLILKGNIISAYIDNEDIVSLRNTKYSHGLAGVGSGFNTVEFDNFIIK